ncbi:MAG: hypothetical protein WCI73_06225, partial [Phycisphaerae bacterium]
MTRTHRALLFQFVWLLGLLCAALSGYAQNLCPNPGFELGKDNQPEGWTPQGAHATWEESRSHAGRHSLKVARLDPGDNSQWISVPIPVTPGQYQLSAWLRASRVQSPDYSYGLKLYVTEYDAAGKQLRRQEGVSSGKIPVEANVVGYNFLRFDWTYVENVIAVGPAATSVKLTFVIDGVYGNPPIGDGAWL